jgi:CRISPR-associated endonuclease/helicase Cas3
VVKADDFEQFYQEVYSRKPFPWQSRLANLVAQSGWPRRVALPTSAGKTSTIDIAVFLLALQSDVPAVTRAAGLRTFFVIDRRVVVDDVAKHARRLAEALQMAEEEESTKPIAAEAARRLKSFGGSAPLTVPLRVSVLRGGTYRDDTWVEMPNQPLVCVTTVDQLGSRLLFRGYGLSDRQCPVHAGLAGCDSVLILDEAHLSSAFAQTLGAVTHYQSWKQADLPGLRFVTMSATLGAVGESREEAFELDEKDIANKILALRLKASKVAGLHETTDFEADAADAALRLSKQAAVVAVVVNSVNSARQIFDRLKDAGEAILLTGRVRPHDRDRLLEGKYGDRLAAKPGVRVREPLFVVATQTVEVGADFDFDALVTEAAPLDALRQRFGRLNRLGNQQGESPALVLLRKLTKGESDPIYGPPLANTWSWLKANATKAKKTALIDFGVLAMDKLLRGSNLNSLVSAPGQSPLMLPAHIEAWSQTNPRPRPDPDVAPFLHGERALDAADVHVVWRADLDEETSQHWDSIVTLAPPIMPEALPLPIWTVRRWLRLAEPKEKVDAADVEGVTAPPDGEEPIAYRPYLAWRGPGKSRVQDDGAGLSPGATIIVPSSYGGVDRYGWAPLSTAHVLDIGDECWNKQAEVGVRRYRLRVHPALLPPGTGETASPTQEVARHLTALASGDPERRGEARQHIVALLREAFAGNASLQKVLNEVEHGKLAMYHDISGAVLTAPRRVVRPKAELPDYLKGVEETAGDITDEEDDGSFTVEVLLDRHTQHVKRLASEFANACGLNGQLAEDVKLAADLHDLGKVDERFQAMLCGGTIRADVLTRPLAKSEFMTYAERRSAKRMSGYPDGGRHELSSVVLARLAGTHVRAHDRRLVLHLIGTHHGFARPFPPVLNDTQPVTLTAEVGGSVVNAPSDHKLYHLETGWADQFRELIGHYGYWGLAYLEAILRRADCVASRIEEESCTRSTATD